MSYNDALKLEVSILEALLQRNRCSQSKAKYYQRTSMALRAIHRFRVIDLSSTAASWKQEIVDRQKEQLATVKSNRSKRQRGETEMWDLASLQTNVQQANQSTSSNSPLLNEESTETLQFIQRTLQTSLPEIISRIEFASQPLLLEISRGFFLPFCTVAMGALARIRVLLMRLGHQVLDTVQEAQQQIVVHTKKLQDPSSALSVDDDSTSQLFWSAQEMGELRNQFTEQPQHSSSSATTHHEIMQRLRESLGFMDGNTKVETIQRESHGDMNHDDEVTTSTKPKAAPHDESEEDGTFVTSSPILDDSDIGEAVLSSAPDADLVVESSSSSPAHHPFQESSATRQFPEPSARHTTLERRVASSSQHQITKKNKTNKTKEGRSEKDSVSKKRTLPAASKDLKVKKEKKKNKKRKKKQDFFDNLFD